MLDAQSTADAWGRIVPGMESGTLRSRKAGDQQATFTDYALARIKLQRLRKQDYGRVDIQLAHRARIVQVWADALAEVFAPNPKKSDVFVDSAGVSWVVDSVEYKLLGNVHDCMCLRAVGQA